MLTPAPPECLTRPYAATPDQLGGTLIAEDVVDRDEHRRRLVLPDGYRPPRCPACDHDRLHAHDFRERHLRGEGERETFRRFRCAGCRASWLVLAAFMARHLHRRWAYVEAAAGIAETSDGPPARRVAARTLKRWLGRLLSSARVVVQAFAAAGVVLGRAADCASRRELLAEMIHEGLLSRGRPMAELGGWVHRLVPGLRLA
ncbi:MAG: transposase family protein [Deltaproteobacteria bacterium]|nr:transposase family protein [Deltaproteobacteria bacterium]